MKKENIDSKFRIRFSVIPFVLFVVLFFIEVLIALFMNDKLIRPYGGDFLVVIMLYCLAKSFIATKPIYLFVGVLLLAYLIEIAQFFKLVEVLELQDNVFMRTIIGSSFSWGDLVAYTFGIACCWLAEYKIIPKLRD